MEEFTLKRDYESELRFTGEEVARASSHSHRNNTRWTVLRLFRTKGGKYVCQSIGHTLYENEEDRYAAVVAEDPEAVVAHYGHGRLAKELYDLAGIEDVQDVE